MFWHSYSISENTLYSLEIGFLKIWIKKVDDDIYIACKRFNDRQDTSGLAACNPEPDTDDLKWNRWIFHSKSPSLLIKPALPDRPLIIKPEIPVAIPRGNGGSFYIDIPVWIQIWVDAEKPFMLYELPVMTLPNSWFGDTISGELCYSINASIRKKSKDMEGYPWNAICTIQIKNISRSELGFDRFCLHAENLTLYAWEKKLWTNQVKIVFHKEEQLSQVTISKMRPGFKKNGKLMSEPRKEIDDNIIKKSFQFLKTITGF